MLAISPQIAAGSVEPASVDHPFADALRLGCSGEKVLPDTELRNDGDLDLQTAGRGPCVLFGLTGKITIDSSPGLRNQLLAALNDAAIEQVTVDLAGVSFIDLSGIATFLEALRIARANNTGLLLTGWQDRPRYLLEVSGLLPFFEGTVDTQRDAALRGQE